MSTLGKEVICTCLAILRLGASAISGSSTFGGGTSGSSSIAFWIASMPAWIVLLCWADLARFSLVVKDSRA